mgnify:CR=1 FL=1
MKIEVVPYEIAHAHNVLERNSILMGLQLSQCERDELAIGWSKGGPAFTLIVDGDVVACAGVVLIGSSRGEAWAALSELFYKHKKTTYKAIRNGLDFIIKKEGLKRVQSTVFDGERKLVCGNFLEHLGFEEAGFLKNFGPHGENIIMYLMERE